MDDQEGFRLLMPFLDKHPSFANGFAMGILWEQLKAGPLTACGYIATPNQDQFLLMASKLGYKVTRLHVDRTTVESAYYTYYELELTNG